MLQNNFTTPEQSKRLLELGVPRRSADEYRDQKGYRHSLEGILDVELFFQNFPDYFPCWSVGRLIEIFTTFAEYYTGDNSLVFNRESVSLGNINCLISVIELATKDKCINFSKLEE